MYDRFLIDGTTGAHSPAFYAWGRRAERAFPNIPKVARCHNYETATTQYQYQCINVVCAQVITRGTKTTTSKCSKCGNRYRLLASS